MSVAREQEGVLRRSELVERRRINFPTGDTGESDHPAAGTKRRPWIRIEAGDRSILPKRIGTELLPLVRRMNRAVQRAPKRFDALLAETQLAYSPGLAA
jgi:hypothetical protein